MVDFKIEEKVSFSNVGSLEVVNDIKLSVLKTNDKVKINIGSEELIVVFKRKEGNLAIFSDNQLRLSDFSIH